MSKPVEKVLLVDDEPRLLAGLRRNLGMHYHILTAEGGAAALQTIAENDDIAVIIADMQMPEMTGVDLLKQVKETAPQIRRMMLTGNSDQETAVAAVNDGAVLRFMRKPCEAETLKDAIEYALEDFRFSTVEVDDAAVQPAAIARDSFLSMMNHEVRTPLNHIIGLAQLIEIPTGQENESSRNFLSTLQDSAGQLLDTLARMLEYSRISSQENTPPATHFDMVELMKDEVDRAKMAGEPMDITMAFDSLRRTLTMVGQEAEIRLAVREVLNNAVKYNKTGGHVGVTLRSVKGKVGIKISDTGIGIPEDQLNRVTGAFTQADEGHTRAHDGIGLGLSLASMIADTNGGAFSIASTPEKGTTVVLSFSNPIQDQVSSDVA